MSIVAREMIINEKWEPIYYSNDDDILNKISTKKKKFFFNYIILTKVQIQLSLLILLITLAFRSPERCKKEILRIGIGMIRRIYIH